MICRLILFHCGVGSVLYPPIELSFISNTRFIGLWEVHAVVKCLHSFPVLFSLFLSSLYLSISLSLSLSLTDTHFLSLYREGTDKRASLSLLTVHAHGVYMFITEGLLYRMLCCFVCVRAGTQEVNKSASYTLRMSCHWENMSQHRGRGSGVIDREKAVAVKTLCKTLFYSKKEYMHVFCFFSSDSQMS